MELKERAGEFTPMSLIQYDCEVSLQARTRALSEEKVAAKEAVLKR